MSKTKDHLIDKMNNSHLIFCYGTLQSRYGNNRLISDQTLLGVALTEKPWKLMDFGGFPGMFQIPGIVPVTGELWEIDEAALPRCDALEGHPNWYRRTPIRVWLEDKLVDCETYFHLGTPHGDECLTGTWRERY